jgi:CRP/FNR family transcriptional regulator, anaerobic regulatory protein
MLLQKTLSNLGVQDSEIQQFMSIFTKTCKYKNGDFFIRMGETVKGIGFIEEGAFRHFYHGNEGSELTHWVSLQEDFLTSMASFMNQTPTYGNIQAIKDSTVIYAKKEDWDELLNQNQRLQALWYKSMEERLKSMEQRLHNLIVFNAEQHYEWMCQNQSRFMAEIPDKYLASMLGITPRHLSRLLTKRK